MSLSDFIAMGGYGSYVWSAYGLTLAALVAECIALRLRRRRALEGIRP